ncbi:MAG: mechanosensitive ion channel family protein [Actinomycetota bacterium]|nr:mechanosensitive ion channel family protein [Actinomycetota bacterium]
MTLAAEPTEVGLKPALEQVEALYTSFVANLPIFGLALVVGAVGLVVALAVAAGAKRGFGRVMADPATAGLLARLVRILAIALALLVALAVAGVEVGPALAGLGLAGLALAFALQGILENFIAGVILTARKPFRVGDQIRTNEFEGTVREIDLRVTRLADYDGETILIPNVDVYTKPLVNLTRGGRRRTRVTVGIDYRDDHDAAREVIRKAVASVDQVMDDPPVEVLLAELGDSSVNFEVRYWTQPDIATVRNVQDAVLSAAKRAVEDAGMTIPWPIRTLVHDSPLRLERD